jgi:hypothetical protein
VWQREQTNYKVGYSRKRKINKNSLMEEKKRADKEKN